MSLRPACLLLFISGCGSLPSDNKNAFVFDHSKNFANSTFYDSAYSGSRFDVGAIFVGPPKDGSRKTRYCLHSADNVTLSTFISYIDGGGDNVDDNFGYGHLFREELKKHGLKLGVRTNASLMLFPDFNQAVKFERLGLLTMCDVYVGHPFELIHISRFLDSVAPKKLSDGNIFYYALGKVIAEHKLSKDAAIPSTIQRVIFEERILHR